MIKEHPVEHYIHSVKINESFFQKYYFHAVLDLNLIKVDSILKNGILTKNEIEQQKLPSIYTHDARDFDSKNGTQFVSLTRYPDEIAFSALFESFTLHTLSSLSFMVDKEIPISKVGERETFFDDEVFHKGGIASTELRGILLPEHLTCKPIRQVPFLANDLSCYTKTYLLNLIDCLERYFGKKIAKETLLESYRQLWDILEEYENPDRWISSILESQQKKYGKDIRDILSLLLEDLWANHIGKANPTYFDVLESLHPNIPVYELQKEGIQPILVKRNHE